MAKKDPILEVKDTIKDNWDNSNTSISYDPQIHTGWYDSQSTSPQITTTGVEESPVSRAGAGGGQTPFYGIDPSGDGPFTMLSGTIQVDCWSDREVESGVNPKKLTYEFSEEVKRIMKNNVTNATDLLYIGYNGRQLRVETEGEPTVFRYMVEIKYGYIDEP